MARLSALSDVRPMPADLTRLLALAQQGLDTDCWPWTGYVASSGYGNVSVVWSDGRRGSVKAHRLAYALSVGPIPDRYTIDHLCRNRSCVNPAHLEAVTQGENTARGEGRTAAAIRAKRDTGKCPRGHDYATNGERANGRCVVCSLESQRPGGRRRAKEQAALIKAARESLGLTNREYVARYGRSKGVARSIAKSLRGDA